MENATILDSTMPTVRRLSKVCRIMSDFSRLRLKIMRIKIDLTKYLLQTLNI